MDWKGWLRTVLGISVLLGIADMLLPKGGTAKFCKLVLGLTLMLAVLQPISNLFSLNPVSVDLDWPGQGLSEREINSIAARVQLAGGQDRLCGRMGGEPWRHKLSLCCLTKRGGSAM